MKKSLDGAYNIIDVRFRLTDNELIEMLARVDMRQINTLSELEMMVKCSLYLRGMYLREKEVGDEKLSEARTLFERLAKKERNDHKSDIHSEG